VKDFGKHTWSFGAQFCLDVTLVNRDEKSQPYSQFDFKIQSPGGDVQGATLTNKEPSLSSGTLTNGGSKTGFVCFDDPGQPGEYIVIWKPDSFTADRGLWFYKV